MLMHSFYVTSAIALALNFYFIDNIMPNFTSTLNLKLDPIFTLYPLRHVPIRSM